MQVHVTNCHACHAKTQSMPAGATPVTGTHAASRRHRGQSHPRPSQGPEVPPLSVPKRAGPCHTHKGSVISVGVVSCMSVISVCLCAWLMYETWCVCDWFVCRRLVLDFFLCVASMYVRKVRACMCVWSVCVWFVCEICVDVFCVSVICMWVMYTCDGYYMMCMWVMCLWCVWGWFVFEWYVMTTICVCMIGVGMVCMWMMWIRLTCTWVIVEEVTKEVEDSADTDLKCILIEWEFFSPLKNHQKNEPEHFQQIMINFCFV